MDVYFQFFHTMNIFFRVYVPYYNTTQHQKYKRILKNNIYLDKGCTFSVCLSPSFEDECRKTRKIQYYYGS